MAHGTEKALKVLRTLPRVEFKNLRGWCKVSTIARLDFCHNLWYCIAYAFNICIIAQPTGPDHGYVPSNIYADCTRVNHVPFI